ncbi:hypothetical protein BVC80_215g9 [Macleaya cordata]|uniref:Uncharacterized protein n=1 Tax=Macleaya cordata TaxID=56857 RepID=A0A200QMA8_MACCD|nr:hypothetical protein BVC80_215g9 [Macleaya cordata]
MQVEPLDLLPHLTSRRLVLHVRFDKKEKVVEINTRSWSCLPQEIPEKDSQQANDHNVQKGDTAAAFVTFTPQEFLHNMVCVLARLSWNHFLNLFALFGLHPGDYGMLVFLV